MTDSSKQMPMRGGIVAAAGILIGTICQASLTDPSQCLAFDPGLSAAVSARAGYSDSARPSLSNGVRQACGSSDARHARVVEPEFLHVEVVEIAGGARSQSN